jgi:polysaccharide biosynthesis/export protein
MFRAQMPPLSKRRGPLSLRWVSASVLLLASTKATAQIPGFPPGVKLTPEQAQQLLESRPDLVQQLRQRIAASGLTPDQIRARLQAAGYPEHMLDPYMLGASDTSQAASPEPGTLGAVQALGLLSREALDSLRLIDSLNPQSEAARARADSLRADSLGDTTAVRGLRRFGLDVFRRATSRFQPVEAGPVDANYRIGPGDVLVLILTGDVQSTQTLEVTREGFIVIPQVGQVYVANLTLAQVEDELYGRLGKVYSGVRRGPSPRTRFTVTVARLRNIQVYVTGDVVRPGAYQISAAGTALTALYAAGGPTDNGSLRSLTVRRGAKVLDTLDVYDYLLRGINRSDIRLESGDVIFVPVRGPLIKVAGQVIRPAIYEVRPSETLRDVVTAAGGFEANAAHGRIQISRIVPPSERPAVGRGRVVIDLSGDELIAGGVPAFPLAAGDSVHIFAVEPRTREFVTVRGDVYFEGRVGFTSGMKLSDAVRLAGGPKSDVYLGQILVSRVQPDSSRIQLRSAFADTTGRVTDDIPLQEEDEVRVFSRAVFRTQAYITVVGAVRLSGRIPYREGMTLRDAVLLAHGLTEDAELDQAEIARLSQDRPTGALAQTIRVPLDSSYLFQEGLSNTPPPARGPAPEQVLQPYDNVLILRRPGWDLQRLVAITGQVQHPGRYALTHKTERLSNLVLRAGGLTTEAYPEGIQFYRRANPYRFTRERQPPDSNRGIQPLPAGFGERVGLDLPEVLKDSTSLDNLILVAGDSIHIPEYDPIVTVIGAVNAPGPTAFEPGRNLDWYVSAAGGYAQNGDNKRAFVTQPDGKRKAVKRRFFFADDVPMPGPGAVVFVPQKGPQAPSTLPATLGVLASVLAALTTVIVVLQR